MIEQLYNVDTFQSGKEEETVGRCPSRAATEARPSHLAGVARLMRRRVLEETSADRPVMRETAEHVRETNTRQD